MQRMNGLRETHGSAILNLPTNPSASDKLCREHGKLGDSGEEGQNCGQAGGKAERLKVRQICGLPLLLTDLERADEQ